MLVGVETIICKLRKIFMEKIKQIYEAAVGIFITLIIIVVFGPIALNILFANMGIYTYQGPESDCPRAYCD